MKDKLLIIGAGGHGKVVADIALKMIKWREVSFLDDKLDSQTVLGLNVIGKIEDLDKFIDQYDIVVGIGNNQFRQKTQNKLEKLEASIPVLIHPSAIIGTEVLIGKGTVIMAGAVINCSTTIGKGCIVNTGATVDHDNHISDFVHISPGVRLAGSVRVGTNTWLGIGSTISNNIRITSHCKIGAGSVVINNIDQSGTYVGIPARRIDDSEER